MQTMEQLRDMGLIDDDIIQDLEDARRLMDDTDFKRFSEQARRCAIGEIEDERVVKLGKRKSKLAKKLQKMC